MKTSLKLLKGNWNLGLALDQHVLSSECIGINSYGYKKFNTIRTEVGEALYQLKYRRDWNQVEALANVLAIRIFPRYENVGVILPMPPSTQRDRQPVTELANALSKIVDVPMLDNFLIKELNGQKLKDINTKAEKAEVLKDSFHIEDVIEGDGPWNALLIDDIFDTGASMEAACKAMKGSSKIKKIYVAAFTKKRI